MRGKKERYMTDTERCVRRGVRVRHRCEWGLNDMTEKERDRDKEKGRQMTERQGDETETDRELREKTERDSDSQPASQRAY